MKLSIIVPVYNAEPYLGACIDSLLQQTFTDWELILIDDGSRDASLALCRKYAAQDRRICCLHQENQGQAAARNAGLAQAKGEWVSFVDADDTLERGCYAGCFAAAEGKQADVISFGFTYINPDGTVRGTATLPSFYVADAAALKPYFKEYRVNCLSSPCKLYRRALLLQWNIRFDASLRANEDTMFNFDVFDHAQGLVHVQQPYYHYWQHANLSVTRGGMTDLWNPEAETFLRLQRFLRENGLMDLYDAICHDWLARAAFNQLCQYSSAGTRFSFGERMRGLATLYADGQALALLKETLHSQPATLQNRICRLSVAWKMPLCIALPARLMQCLPHRAN